MEELYLQGETKFTPTSALSILYPFFLLMFPSLAMWRGKGQCMRMERRCVSSPARLLGLPWPRSQIPPRGWTLLVMAW